MPQFALVCPTCRATAEVEAPDADHPRVTQVTCHGRAFHDHDPVTMTRAAAQRVDAPPIAGAIRPQDVPDNVALVDATQAEVDAGEGGLRLVGPDDPRHPANR